MTSAVFKSAFLGFERPQAYGVDCTVTRIGVMELCKLFMIQKGPLDSLLSFFNYTI